MYRAMHIYHDGSVESKIAGSVLYELESYTNKYNINKYFMHEMSENEIINLSDIHTDDVVYILNCADIINIDFIKDLFELCSVFVFSNKPLLKTTADIINSYCNISIKEKDYLNMTFPMFVSGDRYKLLPTLVCNFIEQFYPNIKKFYKCHTLQFINSSLFTTNYAAFIKGVEKLMPNLSAKNYFRLLFNQKIKFFNFELYIGSQISRYERQFIDKAVCEGHDDVIYRNIERKKIINNSYYTIIYNKNNKYKILCTNSSMDMYGVLNVALHFNITDFTLRNNPIIGIQYHREKEYWIYDIICNSSMYNMIIKPLIYKYFNIYNICEPIVIDKLYNGEYIYYTTFKSKNVLTDNIVYIDDNGNITTDNIDSIITLENGEKLCI